MEEKQWKCGGGGGGGGGKTIEMWRRRKNEKMIKLWRRREFKNEEGK